MSKRIEDYALLGNGHSAALVSNDGSVDWLCLPRFDSSACFARLLGEPTNGFWQVSISEPGIKITRRYRPKTLILETTYTSDQGEVRVIDFMPTERQVQQVVRVVECVRGSMTLTMELRIRFDYGISVPWVVSDCPGHIRAISGCHKLVLKSSIHLSGVEQTTLATQELKRGDRVEFQLVYCPSYEADPELETPDVLLEETERYWRNWISTARTGTQWDAYLHTSLIVLKAMIYEPSGGIIAAPTTSLPEEIGGERNWDYRFCWLRDAALTLQALMRCGYESEAKNWKQWLIRSVAGDPAKTSIMYGIRGERLGSEVELPWLKGYEGSKPVRIGNGAHDQLQIDAYGQVFDSLYQIYQLGGEVDVHEVRVALALLGYLEKVWSQPDEGIWEIRGKRRHFVQSKLMAWVAFDRAVRFAESLGDALPKKRRASANKWRRIRDQIRGEIMELGFDRKQNSFVQAYGYPDLDSSVLLMPKVGFLPYDDPMMLGTLEALELGLIKNGFMYRYRTSDENVDGLFGHEGAFLACHCWYIDYLIGVGRFDEAKEKIDALIGIGNDMGLLSEEYDPIQQRLVGNFPQAFSHYALITTCLNYHEAVHKNGVPDAH